MNAILTNRQTQIINASIEIIHLEGIQGFTIKNLSHAIGVTEAAIYRHFKSKNEILCAVLDKFIKKLKKNISEISNVNGSSIKKIETIFIKLSTIFTKKPAYVSVIFAEEIFKNHKSLSIKVGKILKLNNEAFDNIIQNGQNNLEIIDGVCSHDLTLMIMGSFRLNVKNWKMKDFSFDLVKSTEDLFKSIEFLIKKK